MAQATLVGFPLEAGEKLLQAADDDGLQVTSAFWLFLPDEESWRLILAVPATETDGALSVGRRIRAMLDKIPESERDDLALSDMAIISPRLTLIDDMRQKYGDVPDGERPRSRRASFSSTEPFIYRLTKN